MIPIAGLFDLVIAVLHTRTGKMFGWPDKLAPMDPLNRGAIQIFNVALIALWTIIGLALLLFAHDVAATSLGRFLLAAMLLFWIGRLALHRVYFPGYSRLVVVILSLGIVLHGAALWSALR